MTIPEISAVRIILLERCLSALADPQLPDAQKRAWLNYQKALQDMSDNADTLPPSPDNPSYPYTAEQILSRTEYEQDKQGLKDEYQTAVTTLQSHINETAWTNTKVINAVVFHARVLLFIVKLMKRLVT